jgi:hypothetical protein
VSLLQVYSRTCNALPFGWAVFCSLIPGRPDSATQSPLAYELQSRSIFGATRRVSFWGIRRVKRSLNNDLDLFASPALQAGGRRFDPGHVHQNFTLLLSVIYAAISESDFAVIFLGAFGTCITPPRLSGRADSLRRDLLAKLQRMEKAVS